MAISATDQTVTAAPDRLGPVRIWLYVMALLVLTMVVVGGATRLTESGLSITEWKPISGVIPPLSDADWQAEFAAYKQIPQGVQNGWMAIEDFKSIFWWEWGHRLLGRVLGFAFAIPFLVFLVQRRFTWKLAAPLAGLFVLGGFQGLLGWWMVSSGLSQLTSVSQYRLAAHLFAASLLFIALIWVARRLEPGRPVTPPGWPVAILLPLILLQIVAGAFVAGLDAGMGYNSWPLMDGELIPQGLDVMNPLWKNLFENTLTVQFIHRYHRLCRRPLCRLARLAAGQAWRVRRCARLDATHCRARRASGGSRHWHSGHARSRSRSRSAIRLWRSCWPVR